MSDLAVIPFAEIVVQIAAIRRDQVEAPRGDVSPCRYFEIGPCVDLTVIVNGICRTYTGIEAVLLYQMLNPRRMI